MEEKRGNIVLGIILAILMIIAIVIVIINPNKIEKTAKVTPETQNETKIENNTNNNIEQINSQEENETSMQVGGNFCKIGDKAIFYEDKKIILIQNIKNIARCRNNYHKSEQRI